MGSRVRSVVVTVLFAVTMGVAVWAWWQSPPVHRLIYAEALSDGRVFQCFSDGSTIGPASGAVEGGPTGWVPGAGGTDMVVTPPAYGEDEIRQAVEEYRRSGRSPQRDQADFDRLSAECGQRR